MAVTTLLGTACTGEDKVGDEAKSSGEKTNGIKVEVVTTDATDIAYNSATLNATCSIANGKDLQGEAIFYYGTLNDIDDIKANGKKVVVNVISENTKSFSKVISGLEPLSQYYYVAYITIGDKEYSGSVKSFVTLEKNDDPVSEPIGNENGHGFVDLGLSVKWATCNVGASKPEEYGDYYAWGETEPKTDYSWSAYKFRTSGDSYDNVKLSKYNTNSSDDTFDNKTTLDPEDDVAHVKWGGCWRIPTKAEQDELCSNCTWTWYSSGNTEFNGVAGYKVTSNKEGYTNRFIFLPTAGYRYDMDLCVVGQLGFYWSSSLCTETYQSYAWNLYLYFNGVYHDTRYDYRRNGQSVRPVCP